MTSFLDCVAGELVRARDLHAAISSAHEGYSVILEELDEFWQEVKRKHSDPELMWDELVQVAAMAARTAEDVLRHRPVQLPSAWPGGHDR